MKYTGGDTALDAALKKYSDQYSAARAQGDAAGMRSANDGANMLRNQYGYAAEDASRDIEAIKGQTGYYGSGGSSGGGKYGQYGSLDEYRDAMGYDQVSAAEQAAIDAYIKQTVAGLEGQKTGINQSADEAARQAYISYMQSQAALPQALAASGYSGGMADSQRIALDANLQNAQKDITVNRDNALGGVDTAIQQARLEGSIQGAQSQAQLGRDAISAFQQYTQQQQAMQNQDFWTKYGYDFSAVQDAANKAYQAGQSRLDREWQSGESQADRDYNSTVNAQKLANERAWNIILAGAVPDDGTLEAAGISRAEAEAVAREIQRQSVGKTGGGSGSVKPSMTYAQVMEAVNSGYTTPGIVSAWEYYNQMPFDQHGGVGGVGQADTGMSDANFRGVKQSVYTSLSQGDSQRALGYVESVWDGLSGRQRGELRDYLSGLGYQLNIG